MLGAWPGPIGVLASDDVLEFRLGPSRRRYDSARLDIRYPFELDDENGDAAFEAHLPEEEQMRRFLPRMTTLKPNQSVVTSGLGGIFPKGIPIGKVVDSRPVESRPVEYGSYVEARVKLAANLNALEEVWVLMP
jgi:hypothetical protein